MTYSVSVVIRARNEERFIKSCLEGVFNQSVRPEKVLVVDNMSSDRTADIALSMGAKVIGLSEYTPGRALNLGSTESSSDIIAYLSAHCVPKNSTWLADLTLPFSEDKEGQIAGVYGRQVPLPFSHPQDKRDLYAVFGEEDRVQFRDSFFHNANSAVRRTVWEKHPFDDNTPHIEDRMWGSRVQDLGYKLFYASSAEVYHWNGLHASTDIVRADRSISILNSLGVGDDELPAFLAPNRFTVQPIIPARLSDKENDNFLHLLDNLCQTINSCDFTQVPILVTDDASALRIKSSHKLVEVDKTLSIEEAIRLALHEEEESGRIPDFVLYANPEYFGHSKEIFEKLIRATLSTGSESAFCGHLDYGHFWTSAQDGKWSQIDNSMMPREERSPTYRALYGLGTVTRAASIRLGRLVGSSVTIIPVDSYRYASLTRSGYEISSSLMAR